MKRAAGLIVALLLAVMTWRMLSPVPVLRDGDLIFQTSKTRQSTAVAMATGSVFTHMGIVVKRPDGIKVIEAAGPVRETRLKAWIKRGGGGRYAVYRRPDLTITETATILRAAAALEGRPYDLFFSFDNRAIYCSELPWLAFRSAGLDLGEVQTIGSLNVSGPFANKLMGERSERDRACRGLDAVQCRTKVLKRTLITPVSIAQDRHLKQVYSNYPF